MAIDVQTVGSEVAGSGTSISTSAPSGVVSGDLLLLAVCVGTSQTITTPTGWTQRANVQNGFGHFRLGVYERIADGSGSDTPTVTVSSGPYAARIARADGQAASTPFDEAQTSSQNSTDATWEISSATADENDSCAFIFIGSSGASIGANPTWPTGYVQAFGGSAATVSVAMAFKQVAAGATGALAVTSAGGNRYAAAHLIYKSEPTGDPPNEGEASVDLECDVTAVGKRQPVAAATVGVEVDLTAAGKRQPLASAAPAVDVAITGVGRRQPVVSANVGVEVDLTAVGKRNPVAAAEGDLECSLTGVGKRQPVAAATPTLDIVLTAVGLRPPDPGAPEIHEGEGTLAVECITTAVGYRLPKASRSVALQVVLTAVGLRPGRIADGGLHYKAHGGRLDFVASGGRLDMRAKGGRLDYRAKARS